MECARSSKHVMRASARMVMVVVIVIVMVMVF
jgi:hypothetical protein